MFLAYLVVASTFMGLLCVLAYPNLRVDVQSLTAGLGTPQTHGAGEAVRVPWVVGVQLRLPSRMRATTVMLCRWVAFWCRL